ncbi:DNA alkylation response protein, partial [Mycobacterium tuberculosis]|nr:DNA alkylation response protein [Mycobacterium tuberculosis]
SARRIAQGLALTAQAALMLAYAHPDDAERFIASRFYHQHGRVFGTLDGHAQELGAVLQRAWPV